MLRRSLFGLWLASGLLTCLLTGCAMAPPASSGGPALVQRTTHGVVHVSAPDFETLAYGVAYAHAQDNVCQTAQQLVTVRGQRARWFGTGNGLMGLRALPNEQIDLFMAAHMDDAALQRATASNSRDAHARSRGYVAGYNRFLADHAGRLPPACTADNSPSRRKSAAVIGCTQGWLLQAGGKRPAWSARKRL